MWCSLIETCVIITNQIKFLDYTKTKRIIGYEKKITKKKQLKMKIMPCDIAKDIAQCGGNGNSERNTTYPL